MLKATIILWIMFAVIRIVIKSMAYSIDLEEAFLLKYLNKCPRRIMIATAIWILEGLVSLIFTVITIIMW